MVRPVRDADTAIKIAKLTAKEAGLPDVWIEVTNADKRKEGWLVVLRYFQRVFEALIDPSTGAVLQWREQSQRS